MQDNSKKKERRKDGDGRSMNNRSNRPAGNRPNRPMNARPRGEIPANVVVGRNAVMELVRSGAPVDKLLVAGREGSVVAIVAEAKKAGITVVDSTVESLDRIARGEHHQGIAAMVAEKAYSTVDDILKVAGERGEKPLIVICDGIEDYTLLTLAQAKLPAEDVNAQIAKITSSLTEYTQDDTVLEAVRDSFLSALAS